MARTATITEFTRANTRAIQSDLLAAMQEVGAKYGVVIAAKGGRLNGVSAELKFALGATDGDPKAAGKSATQIRAESDWKKYAVDFGMKAAWLGKSFTRDNGETVKIIGLMPRRRKFPVMVKRGAKEVLLTGTEVARHLGANK